MQDVIGQIIAGAILAVMAWAMSYKMTSIEGAHKWAFKSYAACVCIVVTLAWLFAEIMGAPIEAGEQVYEWSSQVAPHDIPAWSWKKKSEFSHKFFYVTIIPALFGVYCGRRWPDKD